MVQARDTASPRKSQSHSIQSHSAVLYSEVIWKDDIVQKMVFCLVLRRKNRNDPLLPRGAYSWRVLFYKIFLYRVEKRGWQLVHRAEFA